MFSISKIIIHSILIAIANLVFAYLTIKVVNDTSLSYLLGGISAVMNVVIAENLIVVMNIPLKGNE